MKSLVLLLCLARLWGCHSVPHGPGLIYRQPNCDDPETEEAALVAIDYINQNFPWGYKHTLNQIDEVKVWPRRPFGEMFEIEIDTLETTCHVLDPTPVAQCSVRQLKEHAVEGDCDFQLLKVNGKFSVAYAKCDSSPADSAEDVRKVCQDCPLLAPLNDTRVVHAAEAALTAFNAQNNGSNFQLEEISRAQLVPLPPSTYVEFTISGTDCVAKEATEAANCNLLAKKQYGFCKATLNEKLGGEEVAVTCTVFQTQTATSQPQPEGANEAVPTPMVDADAPVSSPVGAPGPLPSGSPIYTGVLAAAPPVLPLHRAHYDLRHIFMGVVSLGSPSGEALHPQKIRSVVQPSVGAAAGPVVPPCPGRVRHFKV
ncbi:PREDICTED: alpha-2-HS-glycoprotein isoform X1 [Colobus angolensis palliatus]|uniref:Alpha-2-HS-glycoprotein n=1 Tax=Colobus angolensis palliatus TaxID=336983 RepID=A0A2K5K0T4_COLAP|nr:PREDICTED: alpha-2-HS-glycoprotein isoform X1 [Colobus angolensis palliatus]